MHNLNSIPNPGGEPIDLETDDVFVVLVQGGNIIEIPRDSIPMLNLELEKAAANSLEQSLSDNNVVDPIEPENEYEDEEDDDEYNNDDDDDEEDSA